MAGRRERPKIYGIRCELTLFPPITRVKWSVTKFNGLLCNKIFIMKTIQIIQVVFIVLATLVHSVGTENNEQIFIIKHGWPYHPLDISVSIII